MSYFETLGCSILDRLLAGNMELGSGDFPGALGDAKCGTNELV